MPLRLANVVSTMTVKRRGSMFAQNGEGGGGVSLPHRFVSKATAPTRQMVLKAQESVADASFKQDNTSTFAERPGLTRFLFRSPLPWSHRLPKDAPK